MVMRLQARSIGDDATWGLSEAEALRRARADTQPLLPEVGNASAPGVGQFIQSYNQGVLAANQQHLQGLEQRIHQQIGETVAIFGPGAKKYATVNEHRDAVHQVQTAIPIGQMALEAQQSAMVAQQQLQSDVSTLERSNQEIRSANEQVAETLKLVTGPGPGC